MATALQTSATVFETATATPNPDAVLALGHPDGPKKGFRVLAMRLHPDRVPAANADDRGRIEEAFKLVKAAWEASPANPDRTTQATTHYASQHAELKGRQPAQPERPHARDGYGGPKESPEAEAAKEAFRRAQAEAAEKAKSTAREAQAQKRAAALANARMVLGGYESGLRGGAEVLRSLLDQGSAKVVADRAAKLAKKVTNMPVRFQPPFDPTKPDARKRLESFRTTTAKTLLDAKTQLAGLETELVRTRVQEAERSKRLAEFRRGLAGAREAVDALDQHQAPPAELEKWDAFLAASAREIEGLSKAARAEANHVADLGRQVERLRSSIPFQERQLWQYRAVEHAESQLRSSFTLCKADFASNTKEWKARIELVSQGLEARMQHLEDELVRGTFSARGSPAGMIRQSVIICSEKALADAARTRASISPDVLDALSPALRTKLEGMFSDFEKLRTAFSERPRREGPPVRIANAVSGLANPRIEKAWNEQVEFGLAIEKARDDALWARRDPTKFY